LDLSAANVSVEYLRVDFDATLLRNEMRPCGACAQVARFQFVDGFFPGEGVRGYLTIFENAGGGARAT
jgi:hypothetical protein